MIQLKKVINNIEELEQNSKQILENIEKYEKILILSHKNPDYDSLSSILSIAMLIKDNFANKILEIYTDLEALKEFNSKLTFKNNFNFLTEKCKQEEGVLLIVLDTADINRVSIHPDVDPLKFSKIISFDHHIERKKFTNLNYYNPKFSSTAESILFFAKQNKLILSDEFLEIICFGILSDTGSLKYSNATELTYHLISEIKKNNVNVNNIITKVNQIDFSANKEFSLFLNNLKVKDRICYYSESNEVPHKINPKFLKYFLNFLLNYKGVDYFVITIYSEIDKEWKTSLRSKKYPINNIAKKYGGGGHLFASGFRSKKNYTEEIINFIRKNYAP